MICQSCNEDEDEINFKCGNKVLAHCRACRTKRARELRHDNPISYKARAWHCRTKKMCIEKGIPFDSELLSHDLIRVLYSELRECPACSREFDKRNGNGRSERCPSIDRIVPEKGYVKGNVAVICDRCNRIKSDGTIEELTNIINYIKKTESGWSNIDFSKHEKFIQYVKERRDRLSKPQQIVDS